MGNLNEELLQQMVSEQQQDLLRYSRTADRITLIIGDRLLSATDPMETFTLGSIMGLLDQVGHGHLVGDSVAMEALAK